MRGDLTEQVVGCPRLAEPAGGEDRDRHLVQALKQVEQQAQRGPVGPVRIVDHDQHRAGVREV